MRVLVAGATGYVGSRLIPRLLDEGHEVRASFQDPSTASRFFWAGQVEAVKLNVLEPDDVMAATEGMDAVVYLVHGMGGEDFVETDRQAAENTAAACRTNKVKRIVYLSGIVPPVDEDELSDHISSRAEVERILGSSGATTVSLRAAILMGSASTSFEIVRQLSERLPVQTIPTWMDCDVQPIAIVDIIEALTRALTLETETRSFDIGGPTVLSYASLLERYAEITGVRRPQVGVPLLPDTLVGEVAGRLIDVPTSTVKSLVKSLHHDMVCSEEDFRGRLLPEDWPYVDLDEAIRRSLAEPDLSLSAAERDPMGQLPHDPDWAGGGQTLGERASSGVEAVIGSVGAVASAASAAIVGALDGLDSRDSTAHES